MTQLRPPMLSASLPSESVESSAEPTRACNNKLTGGQFSHPYSDVPEAEQIDHCAGATGVGGGLHLHFPSDDPGLGALHKDQLRASAIIAALRRAFIEGDVSICLTLNRVAFEWPHNSDALFVFEAITGKQPT